MKSLLLNAQRCKLIDEAKILHRLYGDTLALITKSCEEIWPKMWDQHCIPGPIQRDAIITSKQQPITLGTKYYL